MEMRQTDVYIWRLYLHNKTFEQVINLFDKNKHRLIERSHNKMESQFIKLIKIWFIVIKCSNFYHERNAILIVPGTVS